MSNAKDRAGRIICFKSQKAVWDRNLKKFNIFSILISLSRQFFFKIMENETILMFDDIMPNLGLCQTNNI